MSRSSSFGSMMRLGATQFDWSSGAGWNRVFPHIHAAIRRGAKVLFTSRDYIYRSARQNLKESSFPMLRESQVVIQVERLSREEREQILYNHIRLGRQPKQFKTQIKPYLPGVAAHHRFSPEIARGFVIRSSPSIWEYGKRHSDEFVEKPIELLCEIIRHWTREVARRWPQFSCVAACRRVSLQ